MKIRCATDSIRLRLRKPELQTLTESGSIEESVQVTPCQIFRYRIVLHEKEGVLVQFQEGALEVGLPKQMAFNWASSTDVGLSMDLPNGKSTALQLLLEKDFPCIGRVGENKQDFFGELADNTGQNPC